MRLFLPLLLLALCFTLTVHAQEEQEQVDHANSISITDLIVPPPLLNRTQWTPEEAVLYGQPVGSRCSDEVDAPGVITLYGLIFNPYPVKLSKV